MQKNTRVGLVAAVGDEPIKKEDRRIPGNQSGDMGCMAVLERKN